MILIPLFLTRAEKELEEAEEFINDLKTIAAQEDKPYGLVLAEIRTKLEESEW